MSVKKVVCIVLIALVGGAALLGMTAYGAYRWLMTTAYDSISYGYSSSGYSMSYERYTPQEPAKTAAEWQERIVEMQDSLWLEFADLYAELPPEQEWPEVIATLTAQQDVARKKGDEAKEKAYDFFAALLEGDMERARRMYVASVRGTEVSSYEYLETLLRLGQLGVPMEEAKELVSLKAEDDSSRKSKDKWKQLLADGKVDAAIKALKAEEEWKKLYRIGKLYERADLVEEALDSWKEQMMALFEPGSSLYSYKVKDYLETLNSEGRYEEVIALVAKLQELAAKERFNGLDDLAPVYLLAIAEGRGHVALLSELERLPEFEVDTRAKYRHFLSNYSTDAELLLHITQAYRESGQVEEAQRFLKVALIQKGGNDLLYKEFLAHYSADIGFLDSLLAWDPYEERPLIWKGYWHLQQGELDLAEEAVNRAIALDPSDGEQGKETRMEVYNVLSQIHAQRGNAKDAQFFADVMRAIRAGEVADDFLALGLKEEAIRRYQQALGHFEHAYCLQSRLAKTLLEQGQVKEAKVHFEKAFELMPVSFGPVESHCFGCEGIFESKEAQEVAERVFGAVIMESPENPRTYYLIAKLYEELDRHEEAFRYYRMAFERDPNYYNCAKRLHVYLLASPNLRQQHPDLQRQIMSCYPYADLDQLFKNRLDLKAAWQDAQSLVAERKLPLTVPVLTLPFAENEDAEPVSSYYRFEHAALDGWEAHELLRDHSFLSYDIRDL